MPTPADLRIDAGHAAPAAPVGPGAKAVAATLCGLLADPGLSAPPLRLWRTTVRTAAVGLAEAARRGPILPAAAARFAAVADGAAAARDRHADFAAASADLDRLLTALAATDHAAGSALMARARGLLADAADRAGGAFVPGDLLPAPPATRGERAVAAGRLVAWVASHFRPLRGGAESLVAAALARDAGETPHAGGGSLRFAHAERTAALLSAADRVPPAAVTAAARHHERPDGGGGPRGLSGFQLTPGDRLVAWADRFVAALPAPDPAADDPAAAWRDCWRTAAAGTYAAARRGELCLTVAAAGLEALGLDRGDQGAADAAGAAPVGLALTDLGRTRLRLDQAHTLAAPRFASLGTKAPVPVAAGVTR